MINKKLPPYARNIPPNSNCIAVCTGSECWDRAKSEGWIPKLPKTLLPLNDEISLYKWNFVSGKEILVYSHGVLEPHCRLIELTRALLSYGATMVMWCIPEFKITKFVGVRHGRG